jgi:hypothetical protein
MRIGITGSWKQEDRESWSLRSDLRSFSEACHELGKAVAETGAEITVGSDSVSAADKYVVEGYFSTPQETNSVRVIHPQNRERPFADLYQKYPEAFLYLPVAGSKWRHIRQQFIFDVDAMLTIGGADGTYQAGLEMKLTRKRLVPIGTFGGASSRLLADLLNSSELRYPDRFNRLNNPWTSQLASHVMTVIGANEPSKVLLIHGHAEDRISLQDWLRSQELADPVVMAQEFTAGQTLPEKFEFLAGEADAAIALATPDDLASAVVRMDLKRQRARQNVWVEIGWFWGRLGRNRVLLLVRGDVEIPSDLDGIEYHSYQHSPLELENQIRAFLLQVSQRNQ